MMKEVSNHYEVRQYGTKHRASDDGSIVGEASVFNSLSNNLGGFREIIERGAFDDAQMDDVVALFNHDRNQVLGRTGVSLDLEITESGLEYRIAPAVTSFGKDITALVKRGDIQESSFGFDLLEGGSVWSFGDDGEVLHRIQKIARVWDVSPVTWGAYSATSARSLGIAQELFAKAAKEKEGSQSKLDATQEAQEVLRGLHKRDEKYRKEYLAHLIDEQSHLII